IAAAAKAFISDVEFEAGPKRANAKSTVALMTLGLTQGDKVSVVARGADATQAIAEVARLLQGGLPAPPEGNGVAPVAPVSVAPLRAARPGTLRGVTASPGLASGAAFLLRSADLAVVEAGAGVAREAAALQEALARVRDRIAGLAQGGNAQRKDI